MLTFVWLQLVHLWHRLFGATAYRAWLTSSAGARAHGYAGWSEVVDLSHLKPSTPSYHDEVIERSRPRR